MPKIVGNAEQNAPIIGGAAARLGLWRCPLNDRSSLESDSRISLGIGLRTTLRGCRESGTNLPISNVRFEGEHRG
jgi:hypothetical protein